MFNKKGQAALEFLTTYGWALLVILVMVGALTYFGVFNVDQRIPEKCDFGLVITCTDHVVYDDNAAVVASEFQFNLRNDYAESFTIKKISIKEKGQTTPVASDDTGLDADTHFYVGTTDDLKDITTPTIASQSQEKVTITLNDADQITNGMEGSKKTFLVTITYNKGSSTIDKEVTGEITASVLDDDAIGV